jgi:ferrous iron transport protein A
MNVQWRQSSRIGSQAGLSAGIVRLSEARRGDQGTVLSVSPDGMSGASAEEREELERRLLEIGFVEGARVEITHEGFIGRDPIAVRLDDMRVALRRREAQGVLIRLSGGHNLDGPNLDGKAR